MMRKQDVLYELERRFPQSTLRRLEEMYHNLKEGKCPACGGVEYFVGAACWDCGFEMPGPFDEEEEDKL